MAAGGMASDNEGIAVVDMILNRIIPLGSALRFPCKEEFEKLLVSQNNKYSSGYLVSLLRGSLFLSDFSEVRFHQSIAAIYAWFLHCLKVAMWRELFLSPRPMRTRSQVFGQQQRGLNGFVLYSRWYKWSRFRLLTPTKPTFLIPWKPLANW